MKAKTQKASTPRQLKVLFDLDDTLIPNCIKYHVPALRCALLISKKLGLGSPYPVDMLMMQQAEQMKLVDKRGFTIDVFPKSWVKTYEQLCRDAQMPISKSTARRLFIIANHFQDGPYATFPGVKRVLKYLRSQGHEIHLITAGAEELQLRKVSEAGLDGVFHSVHVTIRDKKDVMKKLVGSRPRDAIMVGDSKKSDMAPAKELGIATVWVPSRTWSYAKAEIEPDYTIKSVTDLPTIVEALAAKAG